MSQIQDDELNLFSFFEILWVNKWVISTFILTTLMIGSVFLFFKEPVYESRLTYSTNNTPPFYESDKVSSDFKRKFFSKSVFKDWKNNNGKTSLEYEDFSNTQIIDGFTLSKDENNLLAKVTSNKNKFGLFAHGLIILKTDQYSLLKDFYKYSDFINKLLYLKYLDRAKVELKIIEVRFENLNLANNEIIQTVLSIDRFVDTLQKGGKILEISYPTLPEKKSPNLFLVLFCSLFSGGFIGVAYVFISKAICMRKKYKTKA
jgi:hypothetical protein